MKRFSTAQEAKAVADSLNKSLKASSVMNYIHSGYWEVYEDLPEEQHLGHYILGKTHFGRCEPTEFYKGTTK